MKEGHCTNMGEGGYRRGMLEDLGEVKEAMGDVCREAGMTGYKVVSPVDLLGIRPGMNEDTLIGILGDDPVHMATQGYAKLAGSCVGLAESCMTLFTGEKRGWEAGGSEEEETVTENYHRRRHEWLYKVVSGTGSWKGGQGASQAKPRELEVRRREGSPWELEEGQPRAPEGASLGRLQGTKEVIATPTNSTIFFIMYRKCP